MTKEEIKHSVSMREVLQHCGLPVPNRAGFIPCPFHKGDREPSLKIYEKDYYCFGCGAHGDVFRFLQDYRGISFRDAFLELGGTYPDEEENIFRKRRLRYEQEARKENIRKKREREQAEKAAIRQGIRLLGICIKMYEPLSQDWCECFNSRQKLTARLEHLTEKR